MNNLQLNSLAARASNGDTEAMWEVKGYFQPFIAELSDYNRNRIPSQESFEEECWKIVEDVVKRFDPAIGNLRQLVVNFIKRRLGRSVDRHRKKELRHGMSPLLSLDAPVTAKNGELVEIEVTDRLATIDSNLLLNEKIASLAGSDPRKLAIVHAWTKSDYTDSSIADLLAQIFGGKSESHRKFIARFKSQCKIALACAV
ncbi:hypothetical protein [Paenibacillus chibensis]|uniref:hypothetical protein n=1 Tax=Paenibacillus chibensis TaxID=59846 RepID=UPI000FDBB169|nr:hypothetical protein [Paenibacillus chibensis]MEC0370004.1 hypothetical protein [Paenibacillus chibensis]